MAIRIRARVSSEDEKHSTVEIPAAMNFAIVFMEPATLMERFGEHQDAVQWRLSAEVEIDISDNPHSEPETYSASLETILLPAVRHAKQAVAILHWPIDVVSVGRIAKVIFRWESDRARASANVFVFATDSASGPRSGFCGLFPLPFPGLIQGAPSWT